MADVVIHTDYYPYGKILREFNPKAEKFLSTHHERDTETGLDYRGARYYDADVVRLLSLDPKQMELPSFSAYSYVAGNPLLLVDPDGKFPRGGGDEPGVKTLSFNGSIKMNTGDLGVKGKIFGIPVGLNISLGGTSESEWSFSLSLSDNGQMGGHFKHIQREIKSFSYTATIGPYGIIDREIKEDVHKFDMNEGATETKDKNFKKDEAGKVKNVKISENKITVGAKASAALWIFGIGAGADVIPI